MKRKLLLVIVMCLLSISSCFATDGDIYESSGDVDPLYVSIINANANINISGNKVSYNATIKPKSKDSISKIVMTLKLVNSKGTIVQTKTSTLLLSGGYFKMSNMKELTSRETYHVEYMAKVYKGTRLVEIINGKSNTKKY